jgi:PHD/YefM family antitoxin component YafN of YafNO toxin-antitoxin module
MSNEKVQYIADEHGEITAVIVPINAWREIMSEVETEYLLKSQTMMQRITEARDRRDGIPFQEVLEKLGI